MGRLQYLSPPGGIRMNKGTEQSSSLDDEEFDGFDNEEDQEDSDEGDDIFDDIEDEDEDDYEDDESEDENDEEIEPD